MLLPTSIDTAYRHHQLADDLQQRRIVFCALGSHRLAELIDQFHQEPVLIVYFVDSRSKILVPVEGLHSTPSFLLQFRAGPLADGGYRAASGVL